MNLDQSINKKNQFLILDNETNNSSYDKLYSKIYKKKFFKENDRLNSKYVKMITGMPIHDSTIF